MAGSYDRSFDLSFDGGRGQVAIETGFPEISIRVAAECLTTAPLWDTVMNPSLFRGEWRMASPTKEPDNVGGMKADKALLTSVAIVLFTDKFSRNPRSRGGLDPRGWWGDGIDMQAQPPMGIELWTLFNGVLSPQVAQQAVAFVKAGLSPLLVVNGGPVASWDVQYQIDQVQGKLDIPIKGYSTSGTLTYDQKWSFSWAQISGGSQAGTPSFTVS